MVNIDIVLMDTWTTEKVGWGTISLIDAFCLGIRSKEDDMRLFASGLFSWAGRR